MHRDTSTIVASNASKPQNVGVGVSDCLVVVGDLLENDWVCKHACTNRFLRPQVIGNNHRKCNVERTFVPYIYGL